MKKQRALPFDAELVSEAKRFKEEGIETLVLSLQYPVFHGTGSQGRNKDVKALLALLEKASLSLSLEEGRRYSQSERDDKRFTHRPLRVALASSVQKEEKRLLVSYLVTVSRRGKMLAEYRLEEALLLSCGARIPSGSSLQKSKKILDFFFKKRYNKRVKNK